MAKQAIVSKTKTGFGLVLTDWKTNLRAKLVNIDYQKKHGYHVDETSAQTNIAEEAINTTVATVSDSSNRSIAVTSDVSFRGAHGWFNNEQTILDLGGCENLVNTNFVHQYLWLQIQTDTSAAAQHIQQSVNGDKFQFTKYVDIQCNFQGHREKVRFYLMDNLPRSFLLGYPFLLDKGLFSS